MLRAFNSKQINVDRDIKDAAAAAAAGDDEHELKVALRRQLQLQFM